MLCYLKTFTRLLGRVRGGFNITYKSCLYRRLSSCISRQQTGPHQEDGVRLRFAPSPTGFMHIGGLRTALYNYLYAKKHNGTFILRIEDTDKARCVDGAIGDIEQMLMWAGLEPDEGPSAGGSRGPYCQSERLQYYNTHVNILLDLGVAYRCFCSAERLEMLRRNSARTGEYRGYDNRCRKLSVSEQEARIQNGEASVIRFKLSDESPIFTDSVYGVTHHDVITSEGDPIIMKSDGFPTYHFANVVDDRLMGVTHVMRGSEWLISTVKHIMLYNAFSWKHPVFAHLPLLMNKDGSKLSKRQGDITVQFYKDRGYMPQTILNWLTFCGSGFEDNTKIQLLSEMVQNFDLDRVSSHSAVLDSDKLNVTNKEHLKIYYKTRDGQDDLVSELRDQLNERYEETLVSQIDDEYLKRVIDSRIGHVSLLSELLYYPYTFLWEEQSIPSSDEMEQVSKHYSEVIGHVLNELMNISSVEFNSEIVGVRLRKITNRFGGVTYKQLMILIRLALTGSKSGPPVNEVMMILGREKLIDRLETICNIATDTSPSR